jgi:hypothetical protein
VDLTRQELVALINATFIVARQVDDSEAEVLRKAREKLTALVRSMRPVL